MSSQRMRNWIVALLLASCASSPRLREGPVIDKLEIEGTQAVSKRELKSKILSSASFLPWLPFFGREEHFDSNAWASDQRRVERFYQAHGFYRARVLEESVTPTQEGHVALRLKVEEGPSTTIRKLEVLGITSLSPPQQQDVLKKLPSRVGKVFEEDDWSESRTVILQRLHQLGYAGATLRALAEVDLEQNKADLTVNTNLGRRYRFGKIYITPPQTEMVVSHRLIRDQAESEIQEGNWFDPASLEEAQARVFKMGVFAAVKVTRGALDQASGIAPVIVDVREAPFRSWRFGGGIGGDALRNSVSASGLYEDRNFLGGTRRFTVRGRGGYAFLAGSSSSGFLALASVVSGAPGSQHGPFGNLIAEIEQPHFLSRALAVQWSIEPTYQIEPAFRYGGGSSRVALVWRPTSHLTASLSYSGSVYRLSAPPVLGVTTTGFVGCGLTCFLSVLEQTVAWDHRDNLLEPREGFYAAMGVQEGGNSLATGGFLLYNFLRIIPELRGYISFFDNRLTVAARARVGLLWTQSGTAPISVRFFSGGNDMRGFSARRLAPYEVVPRDDCRDLALDELTRTQGVCPGNGEVLPVGGNLLVDGSLELRWSLFQDIALALFSDVGYVSSSRPSVTSFGATLQSLNVAVGLGVRYRTPIGPIRLDIAGRLPLGAPLEIAGIPRQHATSRGCFFGLGAGATDVYPGSPEGQCAFHVSVGEAF